MKNNLAIKIITLILLMVSGVSIYRVVSFGIHMHKTAHIVEKLQTQRIVENKEESVGLPKTVGKTWKELTKILLDI